MVFGILVSVKIGISTLLIGIVEEVYGLARSGPNTFTLYLGAYSAPMMLIVFQCCVGSGVSDEASSAFSIPSQLDVIKEKSTLLFTFSGGLTLTSFNSNGR